MTVKRKQNLCFQIVSTGEIARSQQASSQRFSANSFLETRGPPLSSSTGLRLPCFACVVVRFAVEPKNSWPPQFVPTRCGRCMQRGTRRLQCSKPSSAAAVFRSCCRSEHHVFLTNNSTIRPLPRTKTLAAINE